MSVTRRRLCALLPAVLAPTVLISAILPAEANAHEGNVLPTAMYPFEKLTRRPQRQTRHGRIRGSPRDHSASGRSSPPAAPPSPHCEMWLIREGTVELTVEGRSTQMGPGSVGFVHSNEEHGIKNIGAQPSTYYVVAIGPGADGA